ncbi:MAG: hypothetical protein HYT62_04890 [Candidatus Yanofskybacteria bacterium]|nr:hypothetical protein [Candidatus Yanofskybacteria bacterium]
MTSNLISVILSLVLLAKQEVECRMGFIQKVVWTLVVFFTGFVLGHVVSSPSVSVMAGEAVRAMHGYMFYHWYVPALPFFIGVVIGSFKRKMGYVLAGILLALLFSFFGSYLTIWNPANFSFMN